MLGLDERFSRDIVHGVICLAFDVLEEMGAAKAPQGRNDAAETSASSSSSSSSDPIEPARLEESGDEMGSTLNLDGYDEATRLDADALLGSSVPRRPSDPLGEESRRGRVMYYYR